MPVALCIPLPFSALCDDMLTILVCDTCWLSLHLYTLAYMSMHESCSLVCCPYFNTMKLWTFNSNLHLSLADTSFYLLSCLFPFWLAGQLSCFCHMLYLTYLSFLFALHPSAIIYASLHFHYLSAGFLFLPSLACTHIEQGHIELGHNLSSVSKKGAGASIWI